MRIRRYYCRTSQQGFSLIPDFLAARVSGCLHQIEDVVAHVEDGRSQQHTWRTQLPEAIAFWHAELGPQGPQNPQDPPAFDPQNITQDQTDNLLEFLAKIKETKDFTDGGGPRKRLAFRILELLQLAIYGSDDSRSSTVHEAIADALTACGDRVSLCLNEIETYLAMEIGAAQQIPELPVASENMIFFGLAQVEPQHINAAVEQARTAMADPEQLQGYLATWPAWQQFMHVERVRGLKYGQLPTLPLSVAQLSEALCVLTQYSYADLKKPVLFGRDKKKDEEANQYEVFEFAAKPR
jgi:hypothetical protein